MKKGVVVLLLALAACAQKPATVTTGGAIFELSGAQRDTLVDIGVMRAGEVIQYDAWLKNTGTEPLVITGITTSCGCTSIEYERQPIAAGEKGAFSFRFDSSGMWGMQMKLIEIKTSDSPTPYRLTVKAQIQNN